MGLFGDNQTAVYMLHIMALNEMCLLERGRHLVQMCRHICEGVNPAPQCHWTTAAWNVLKRAKNPLWHTVNSKGWLADCTRKGGARCLTASVWHYCLLHWCASVSFIIKKKGCPSFQPSALNCVLRWERISCAFYLTKLVQMNQVW